MQEVLDLLEMEQLQLLIDENKEQCRYDFWLFCKSLAPDFYKESRPHLKKYCNVLQDFYERKLVNKKTKKYYKKLIVEMPPRHGKTRTLIMFCAWIIGLDNSNRIITASYSDSYAFDFSKFTRNLISEEKLYNDPYDINLIYSDIFPSTKIKKGDGSMSKWAVDGQYFNFKSAGKGGAITGSGGNVSIIEDPVKNAKDAFNANQLALDWQWYADTWSSRKQKTEKGAPLEIICHTPWAKNDIGGIIQEKNKDDFFLLKLAAYDKHTKTMLCDDILTYEEYLDLEKNMDKIIFKANYDLERIDAENLLYGDTFKTYTELPRDEKGKECYNEFIFFADTADRGTDNFCGGLAKIYNGMAYIIDIYYSQESVKSTEPEIAKLLISHKCPMARFEGNSAGHAIAVHIERILNVEYNWFGTLFDTYFENTNKQSRILANAKMVIDRIVFPINWALKWSRFHKDITEFTRGKNLHDDAADMLTQIIIYLQEGIDSHFFIKRN